MGLYSRFVVPWLLEFAMSRPQAMELRPRVLATAEGDVLEIGFGTGLNLTLYPQTVRQLNVLDPATMLQSRVQKRIAAAKFPIVVTRGDGAALPFDAGRFDCVVSTWTLCSIDKVTAALAEIRRVLKPTGQFLFVEHGLSTDPHLARWQNRLDRPHGWIAGGCHVNRPIDHLIAESGLTIEKLERFDLAGVPRYLCPHYLGMAKVA